ncbi:MAG TPA: PAS domain S-box protein [Candidatus Binataceae bacterium]|nr:PAS domain S-box protein [Candidatus Binataceae bacterium]
MGESHQTLDRGASTPIATVSAECLSTEALAAAIVESCSDAIIPTALDGTIIGWNAAATELLGYNADETIGRSWHFLVRSEIKDIARAARRLENGERSVRLSAQLRRKDNSEFDTSFLMSPIRDRSGVLIGFSGIFRDITQEKIAEDRRRQSEEKFKTIFKNSTDAISLASMDARYIDVNDEFCRMVHRPPEQIIGKTAVDLGIITLPQQEALEQIALQTGGLRNHEVTLTDPYDGVAHRLLVSAVLVEFDGEPCMLGIIKDITELRRAEDELLRLERQFNDVLDNAPLALLAFDKNHRITAARGRALSRLSCSSEQMVGKPLDEVFRPSDPIMRNSERALAGDTFSAIENVNRDQLCFETWYSPLFDHQHGLTGATAVATDITDRKRAEDELRRSEEYYRSLVESSADLTVVSDRKGTVLFAAGEGHRDLGFELSELVGRPAIEFIHPDKHLDQLERIAECFAHPYVIGRGEAPIRCKDGSWLECELIGRAGISTDGSPILVSTVRNISARKAAEAEIAKSRDQALAASRAKSEFLSSMSHEIRTPMNAVLGMADLLWETDLTGEQRRYLSTVINNGNALLELINSILDLAKVESGRLNLEALDFDLREVVEKVADTLAVRADEKGVELGVRIDQDVPTALVGDPLRLRQVLTNLVGNAIKFTERGAVVIRIRRNVGGAGPGALVLSVTDTGIGIPADKLATLFDPFSQADSSVTRRYGGTGLGLAIVERLVRLMGGFVSVDSEPGRGSTFSFTAEFAVRATPGPTAEIHQSAPDLRGVKVLVVDDNQINRTIVREMLLPLGAIVVEAGSGLEAIDQFRCATEAGEPFRLLISDHMMPGMDGFEMVSRIRENYPDKDLTIMMLSSNDLPNSLAKVRKLHIGWYVVKPIKRAEFHAAILNAMAAVATLPAHRADPVFRTAVASRPDIVVQQPLRIMLADDSADNRMLIRAYLRRTPYQLDEVDDGAKAAARIVAGNYDVVLMDIQMPVMDGYSAVEKIREWESRTGRERVPVIALTASALDDAVQHTREVGFDMHVSKPVKRGTLLEAIAQAWALRCATGGGGGQP